MVSRLLQTRAHVIFCLRAEDKVKFQKVKGRNGRDTTEIVPIGWQPVCEKGFMFEMSGSLTLAPDRPGAVNYELPRKLNAELLEIFKDGEALTEAHGAALRNWAEKGENPRATADKVSQGAQELAERFEDADDISTVRAITAETGVVKQRAWLAKNRPELSAIVEAACTKAVDRFSVVEFSESAEEPDELS
jgi:hypothetical protein